MSRPLLLLIVFIGSYAFTWGFVALGVATLVLLGVTYGEAETALLILAFLVFLPVFLFSFASPRHVRVIALLFGGATLMFVSAATLQRIILT